MSAERNAANRTPITVAVMLATVLNTLDSTIANVALPHIQGSLSASRDQIGWVMTSYIVAAAMVTPLSGWISTRFGVKRVLVVAIAGFTTSSMLCGVATSLPELVLFRLLQGSCGAFTLPLAQAVMLNINPPERHARAMSLWAMATVIGPVLGPLVGGYITDNSSWRWCFYLNLPVGAVAGLGVLIFMHDDVRLPGRKFDFLGFGALIVSVAALQLMLDRGPGEDWFSSIEIWTEALVALTAFWIFVTHTMTTRHPFIDLSLLRDRNLAVTSVFSFLTTGIMFGSLTILPILTQTLMGYPVLASGIVSMPRGLGSFLSMWAAPRLVTRLGMRMPMLIGLALNALSLWWMMHFDLAMSSQPLIIASLLQGVGMGLVFVPMTTFAFTTVPAALRPDAMAMFNLLRAIGASLGISIMLALATANTQAMHASLAAHVIPSDPVVRWGLDRAFSPQTVEGALALDAQLNRQASMVSYLDDFRLMFVVSLFCIPLVLILKAARRAPTPGPAQAAME